MLGFARPVLLGLFAAGSIGCGQVQLPITLALVGENTVELEIAAFPPPNNVFGTTVIGGAEATAIINLGLPQLFQLLSPQGLAANIVVNRVNIAGGNISFFGLSTGTICLFDDPANPSGGMAFLRPLQNEGDFHLTLNTLISPTDPFILGLLGDPLAFSAEIDDTTRVTLADLVGLLAGKPGNIQISQQIEAVVPDDVPIFARSIIRADVTLAAVEELPTDPSLTFCENFVAGL